MNDRETVISHLQILRTWASFAETRDINFFTSKHFSDMAIWIDDTLAMLKEQDEEHRRLLSWLGKFCRHIDNGDAWLTDEENIAFFKEKMKQQFGWDTD